MRKGLGFYIFFCFHYTWSLFIFASPHLIPEGVIPSHFTEGYTEARSGNLLKTAGPWCEPRTGCVPTPASWALLGSPPSLVRVCWAWHE